MTSEYLALLRPDRLIGNVETVFRLALMNPPGADALPDFDPGYLLKLLKRLPLRRSCQGQSFMPDLHLQTAHFSTQTMQMKVMRFEGKQAKV